MFNSMWIDYLTFLGPEGLVESQFRDFEEAKDNLKTSRSIVQNY
jgi:hypothetical protein